MSIANLSEFTYDIISKAKSPYIIENLLSKDTKISCDDEIKVQDIINNCKLSKNINTLKEYIISYAKEKVYNIIYKNGHKKIHLIF